MLELKNICFTSGNNKILDQINLTIDTDRFIAITGPNGSGKSTLVKIIMGIENPDSGQILFNDIDITNLTIDERAKIGIAFGFQQPVRFKGITVYDLLKLANGKNLSQKEACKILSSVGLCGMEYLNRELNSSLSGGELKRIEIATVALRNSKLTIFDEPEAGIDLWSFNNLIEVFKNIRDSIEGTTIVITHQERILNIADEIILIKNGKIAAKGNKKEMFSLIEKMNNCNMKGECNHEYCHK